MYRVRFKSVDLLKVPLVTAAAMLAMCLLALVEMTNTAEAEDSLRHNGKIVFSSNRDGDYYELYTIDSDGSSPRKLTNNTDVDYGGVYGAVLSPDGTKIAVSNGHILVMNVDGSDLNWSACEDCRRRTAAPAPTGASALPLFRRQGSQTEVSL